MSEERRRPGRPRVYAEEPARIDIRVAPEIRRRIRVAAAEADMGLGEWVIDACMQKLAHRKSPPAAPTSADLGGSDPDAVRGRQDGD